MRLIKIFTIAIFLFHSSWSQFNPSRFNFGADWDFLSKNLTGGVASSIDYATIWLNDPSFNQFWHGDMLKFCKENNKTPVFYAYIVAKASGLGDADVGGRLDAEGGKWLRANLSTVLSRYENYAEQTANTYGTDKPIIWLMEPDYYQYCNGNDGVSYSDAAGWMNQMIASVKKYLPLALFSLDISPWNNDQTNYIKAFDMSKFSFMHTSGGRTEAGGDRIRNDNNNNVTWSAVHSASGKCIIADDGYGSGGSATGHDATWDDINNIKARIANGVVAITQKSPKTDWGPIITSSKSSLSASKCDCGVTIGKPSYSINLTVGANGKVTKSPDAGSYDSGAVVTLTATPNSGYKLKSWSGDVTGTNPTVTVTMASDKTISAQFADVNAKTTYTLSVNTVGSGVVEITPKQMDYDSGTTVAVQAFPVNGASFTSWSGALSGNSRLATLFMNGDKTVTAAFTGNAVVLTNLLKNGDFSDGANNWSFGTSNNAKGTGAAADGVYKISIEAAGTEAWHIQLLQGAISLKQNEKYVLSFSASSQSNTDIVANVGMGADPYTSYSQERTISLTPTKTTYKIEFTMKEASTSNARVDFNCGKASSGLQLDDVSLTVAIEIGTINPRPLFGQKVAPDIAGNQKITITWFDHAGRMVKHSSGDYSTLMQQKHSTPGPRGCFIEVMNIDGRKLVKRIIVTGK
jgi:hypothetical protein